MDFKELIKEAIITVLENYAENADNSASNMAYDVAYDHKDEICSIYNDTIFEFVSEELEEAYDEIKEEVINDYVYEMM